jgi:peroxiredoxin
MSSSAQRRAKRTFVTPYVGFQISMALLSAWRLITRRGERARWLGGALTHGAPASLYLRWLITQGVARTPARLWNAHAVSGAGVALLAARRRRAGWSLPVAVGGLALDTIYEYWYTDLGRERSAVVEVGATMPDDLEFFTPDGTAVTSGELLDRPTAWLFYRGNWCPLCMAQVAEMADRWASIDRLGGNVALVSPQDDKHTRALAARHGVPFHYLRDEGLRSATRLGLLAPDGLPIGFEVMGYEADTVMPTVLVTDADGRIVFSDQTENYRVRPEPDAILEALRTAGLRAAEPQAATA